MLIVFSRKPTLLLTLALVIFWGFEARADSGLWELLTSVNAEKIKAAAAEHIWLALSVCFFGGILTSFTPCVYPMIPVTINIFGRAAQNHSAETRISGFNLPAFMVAVFYVAGMCLTYSIMGLIAGLTGSLFGKVLQSSYVLFALTLLFLSLALAQFGLFKMTLPASWQTRLASVGNTESKAGVFVIGLISGLIVSPCVGPVIAGILAFIFETSNALLGLLYFLSFSLGLGVLFLVLGGFSGLLTRLPRSGKWMLAVNQTLALLLVVASTYYGLLWAKQVGLVKRMIPSGNTTGIEWLSDEKKARSLAHAAHKPIVVDFTAEWCEACHELERTVFQDPKVIEKISSHFLALRFDVTDENTPSNEEVLARFRVLGLPTIAFLDRDGSNLDDAQVNGVISPDAFLQVLEEVLSQ